ncbi:MAG: (2Fe-2S)-binding protein [Burkholderiales bacterium]|nr:MAG: (2Fe-2S)-binding protein [Burkholderiales bacterium]
MPTVTFVLPDGSERRIDAVAGTSVMLAAVEHDLPGIVGECGGCASCATCHVYVDPAWAARLEPADEVEDDLLGFAAAPRRAGSRLACQIEMDASLDGLRVEIPPEA